jgi:hypothetical protein
VKATTRTRLDVRRCRALLIYVPLAGNGTGSVSGYALRGLGNQVVPATVGKVGRHR